MFTRHHPQDKQEGTSEYKPKNKTQNNPGPDQCTGPIVGKFQPDPDHFPYVTENILPVKYF